MECKDLKGLCWVLLICLASTSARFLNDTQNENSNTQGTCFYNGTWYEEKEELPTRGLCLICHCFPGFTEPNAFTCAVIDCPWEDYHKRFPGCTPIYADRDCCPIGWECDYGTQNPGPQQSKDPNCDCEWRYLKHYEAKGCRPVYEEKPRNDESECTCPWRFDCSQAEDINADERVCLYKKHVYPVGSKIPTINPCETCSCAKDYFTQAATISCTTTECPSVYSQTPLPEGCHYVYKENQCCPTSVECPAAKKEEVYKVPMCEYKGKMYYEGEQIYPDEDPCLICLCNQNWTGVNSTSCRQHDCMLERDSRKLKQGCIPIYHEKTCCPIDYHCADDDFEFQENRGGNFKSDDDEDEMCHFEGRYYTVGHVLDIKHPTHCVTCTCKTPPDFTCIHSSCPPPPNGDYANCRAVYKPNACCPDYKCHEKKEDAEISKKQEQNENVAEDPIQMLIQECKKTPCSVDERCMLVEKKCENDSCQPVPQCEKVSFGCGQKSCPEGCQEIGSYENSCPICYCKNDHKSPQYKLTCHVQSCEENCVLSGRDQDGCPICKCPQGNLEERACAESLCKGYNCTMIVNSLGCAECRCQLSCKPRECPVGCDMDLDVSQDNGLDCACACKNSSTAIEYIHSKTVPTTCQPVTCQGLNCIVGEDQAGCPTCNCKSPCPEPECQDGCQIEKNVKEPGRCPGCVCKLSRSARDNAPKDCPPPTCLGYNCSVITGEDGCQKCLCESPCEASPKCPSHCKLETDVPEGRCRGCICSLGENAGDSKDQVKSHVDSTEPERREDIEADYIPLPGKEIVPGVDKIYLIHGDSDQDQYSGIPGYHYEGGHAYPVEGEHLDSAVYSSNDRIPGEIESGRHDDLYGEASEDRHEIAEYHDIEPDYAEEKSIDDEEDEKCLQKNCPEGQKCVIRRLQCIRTPCPTIPVCIDVEPRCPIPMCSIGCMVMKWDDEVCPSCFCGIIRGAEGRVCPRTRCIGRRCYNVIGDDGCPTCKCDSICIPPTCSDGCWIETEPPEGKCPTCTCPSRSTVIPPIIPVSPTAEAYGTKHYSSKAPVNPYASYHCPTPHCNGYNCSLIRGSDGCQKCVCDSPCAPCPQHCVKTKTLSEGRCPICDCTMGPVALSRPKNCPPVHCPEPNCRTTRGPDGCIKCLCDSCPPPKCDPGCELQRNVAQGQCPTCVCPTFNEHGEISSPNTSVQLVQSIDSIKNVMPVQQQQSQITFAGFVEPAVADEESTYSTPHTTVTVDLEITQSEDTTIELTTTTTETPTTTCPPPVCSGLRCSFETSENGCEVCKCRYKCPKPKCVGSCYAETNAPPHRCPGCVCPSRRKPALRY